MNLQLRRLEMVGQYLNIENKVMNVRNDNHKRVLDLKASDGKLKAYRLDKVAQDS